MFYFGVFSLDEYVFKEHTPSKILRVPNGKTDIGIIDFPTGGLIAKQKHGSSNPPFSDPSSYSTQA